MQLFKGRQGRTTIAVLLLTVVVSPLTPAAAGAVTWIREEVMPSPVEFMSVAMGDTGSLHLSYWEPDLAPPGGGQVTYGVWDGTSWSFDVIESQSISPEGTSIAIDDDGRPHVTYRGEDLTLVNPMALRHAVLDGGVWFIESVDSVGMDVDVGRYSSIGIRDTFITIAYQANYEELRSARWSSTGWVIDTVDAWGFTDDVGQRVSVSVAPSGFTHLAYRCTRPDSVGLRYALNTSLGWDLRLLEQGDIGHWPAVALDPAGQPHFAHAEWQGGGWQLLYTDLVDNMPWTVVVDDTGSAGEWAVHRIDRWGNPQVGYWDGQTGRMRYARYCESEDPQVPDWQTETADSLGPPSSLLAMDVSYTGSPHLLYLDASGSLIHSRAAPLTGGASHVVLSPKTDGVQFHVNALDEGGSPLPGAEIIVDFSACPEVQLCLPDGTEKYGFARGRYKVRALADCFGSRTIKIRGGGNDASPCVKLWINGVLVAQEPAVSTDTDGDLDTDLTDQAFFMPCFISGLYDPLCDLDGDGSVGLADVSIYAANHNSTCPTAVSIGHPAGVASLQLLPAAPNPTNGSAALVVGLPVRSSVKLEIYDLLGRRVRTLVSNRTVEAGVHRWIWDGRDDAGRPAGTGVYRCQLRCGNERLSTAIVLMR